MPESNENIEDQNQTPEDNASVDDSDSPKSKEKEKKKRRPFVFFFKFLFGFLGVLLLIPVSLYFLNMNEDFRKRALEKIVNVVNENLAGTISVDDIDFFDKDGIRFKGVMVKAAGDTLANIPEMLVDVTYRDLLDNKVHSRRVTLTNPKIKLIRGLDSVWTISRIANPSEPDTTTTQSSPWFIDVGDLVLENAELIYRDSLSLLDTSKPQTFSKYYERVNYYDMHLDNLNLSARDIIVDTGEQLYKAEIKSLSLKEIKSDLHLNDLAAQLRMDKTGIFADDLSIDSGDLELVGDLSMTNFNAFGENDPIKAIYQADIQGEGVNGNTIAKFAPLPLRLKENAIVDIDIKGTLQDMSINKMVFEFGKSIVELKGNTKNLTIPDSLIYDINISGTKVYRPDMNLIEGLDLTSLPQFGTATFYDTQIKGGIYDVVAATSLKSGIGNLKGKAKSSWKSAITYSFDGHVANFDLAKLTTAPSSLSSDINGYLKASGRGTDLSTLKADLDFNGTYNRLNNYEFDSFKLDVGIEDGIADLRLVDIFKGREDEDDFLGDDQYLKLVGIADLNDLENLRYDLSMEAYNLELSDLLDNEKAPNFFTGTLELSGRGTDINDIEGELTTDIELLVFDDRALLPFSAEMDFKNTIGEKMIKLDSDFLFIDISGEFDYEDLFTTASIHTNEIIKYGMNQANKILKSTKDISDEPLDTLLTNISEFPPLNANIYAVVKELSPISIFLDSINLYCTINLNLSINNTETTSRFSIDSISVSQFGLEMPGISADSKNMYATGDLTLNIVDEEPKFEGFRLDIMSPELFHYNEAYLRDSYLYTHLDNDTLAVSSHINLNDLMNLAVIGDFYTTETDLEIRLPVFDIGYDSLYIWSSKNTVEAKFGEEGFYVHQFLLQRQDKEVISISGRYDAFQDRFENVGLYVTQFDFANIQELLPNVQNEYLGYTTGKLDTLSIYMNGSMESPVIDFTSIARDLVFNDTPIGELRVKANHKEGTIEGKIESFLGDSTKIDKIKIDLESLPYDLTLTEIEDRWHQRVPVKATVKLDSVALALADPFLDFMSRSVGYVNLQADINGKSLDDYSINGNINYKNIGTVITALNVPFYSTGDIDFNADKIEIKEMLVRNTSRDLQGSKARVTGNIDLEKFVPKEFNIEIDVDKLKVLRDASRESLPTIYGDLVVSTGNSPIKFTGTMEYPRMVGDIEILQSDLRLPLDASSEVAETKFNYYWVGDTMVNVSVIGDDFYESEPTKEISYFENLYLNLRIFFPSSLDIAIDINELISLDASVGTRLRGENIRFIKEVGTTDAKILGDVAILDNSNLKFAGKEFITTGNIGFPGGNIENPELNINAIYNGRMTTEDNSREFKVTINITGTKDNPQISYDYIIEGDVNPNRNETQLNDILQLIVMGTLPGSQNNGQGSALGELGGSATSQVLGPYTKELFDKLTGGLGFITSADFNYGGSIEQSTLRLRGKIIDGVYITGGGSLYGGEVTIEIPLAELTNSDFAQNFRLQFTQYFNDINQNATTRERINSDFRLRWAETW
ncbi:MAG: hypothetical protein Kapaf2KO_04030 [Candidatus Kapaibacteriales bacterium]